MRLASNGQRSVSQVGQSLVLIALMLPVLLGFLGLAVDFGRLAAEQRVLQNQADAAALAGAADLSKYYTNACTDAQTSLTNNGYTGTPTCNVYQTTYADDTIRVDLTKSLPMDFLPVLGITSKTLTATAIASAASITGCNDNANANQFCAPYAVWRPGTACTGNYTEVEPGEVVIIRSSQSGGWVNGTPGSVGTGAGNCNADWTVSANDFKGYLRPYGSSVFQTGNNVLTKGGNACGQEPVSDIQNAFAAGETLIIPVIDSGTGGQGQGNPSVHIPGFVTVTLHFTYPYPGQIQAVTINGNPTGGTFALTFNGNTTSAIPYNASASTVQSSLESLASVGSGNVAVTQNSDGSYTVSFQGSLAGQSLPILTASSSLTGGSSPSVTVTASYTSSTQSQWGQASQQSDYTCPATWFAKIVDSSTSLGGDAGISQTGQCLSTAYVCRVTLIQ